MSARSVFITGASGGIGEQLVAQFAAAGWQVFAGHLGAPGPSTEATWVPLDVTDDSSVVSARARVGVPELLINNAGIGLLGPVAELPDEALVRQFEVNVRGLARITRAFAPDMCRRGHGRIINISSLAGRVSLPWFGAYSASKYAVEALSDALRLELAPFGVRVCIIEPTIVGTAFVDHAVASLERARERSLWRTALDATLARVALSRRIQIEPAQVASVVLRAASARRPSARYRVGTFSSLLLRLGALLPVAWNDALLRSLTGLTVGRRGRAPRVVPGVVS